MRDSGLKVGEKQVHDGYCLLAGQEAETKVPCMCLRVADSGIVPGIQFWGKIPVAAPILVPALESSSSTEARQKKNPCLFLDDYTDNRRSCVSILPLLQLQLISRHLRRLLRSVFHF